MPLWVEWLVKCWHKLGLGNHLLPHQLYLALLHQLYIFIYIYMYEHFDHISGGIKTKKRSIDKLACACVFIYSSSASSSYASFSSNLRMISWVFILLATWKRAAARTSKLYSFFEFLNLEAEWIIFVKFS